MRHLIFVPNAMGHHLEYTNHLVKIAELNKENQYIFCIHEKINNNPEFILNSREVSNIEIDIIKPEVLPTTKGYLFSAFHLCKVLKKKAIYWRCHKIFLIMIMPFSPFIFLPFWKGFKISGIIYKIPLYNLNKSTIIHKIYDISRLWLATKSRHIENIFVLNDELACKIYNKNYKTNKFKFLVDPFFSRDNSQLSPNKLIIKSDKKIVSHIGVLKERKGTYEILKAINESTSELFKDYLFIFAGEPDDNERFITEVNRAKHYASIMYYNSFLPFGDLCEIVRKSYCILLPYKNTDQSSGTIGYAAKYGIPVIVPKENLLKRIVIRYKLGYFLDGNDSECIIKFFKKNKTLNSTKNNQYCNINNVDNFISIINNNF